MNQRRPFLVSIEGNIGAGKSTVLEHLETYLTNGKILFLKEPLDIWEQFHDTQFWKNFTKTSVDMHSHSR